MPPPDSASPLRDRLLARLGPDGDPRLRAVLASAMFSTDARGCMTIAPVGKAGVALALRHLETLAALAGGLAPRGVVVVPRQPSPRAGRAAPATPDEVAGTASQAVPGSPRNAGAKPQRFSNFRPWDGVQPALDGALGIANEPGSTPSPLLLHGPPGVGKTHLLRAVAAAVPGGRYLSAETYTRELVESVMDRRIGEFKRRVLGLPILVLDDLQVLAGRKRSLTELFLLVNEFALQGKPAAFAMDRPPEALADLPPRLVSRLLSGLVVRMSSPEPADRLDLLRRFAAEGGAPWPAAEGERAMGLLPADARVVQGVARRYAWARRTGRGLNAAVSLALAGLGEGSAPPSLLDDVAAQYGVSAADILSKSRRREVTRARWAAAVLLACRPGGSQAGAGRALGIDRSSVGYALKAAERDAAREEPFRAALRLLAARHGVSLPFSPPAASGVEVEDSPLFHQEGE